MARERPILTNVSFPLSEDKLRAIMSDEHRISVVLPIDFTDLINAGGIDGLNDLVEERIVADRGILADLNYTVVGHQAGKDYDAGVVMVQVDAELVIEDEN